MRSRSKGNNDMQAMGCFETDRAQARSKSPKARAVQHSGQRARVQSVRTVQCKQHQVALGLEPWLAQVYPMIYG